jgi:hypothetical protein
MTTPAVTPQTPNPLAEFGGVSVDASQSPATAQPTTPSSPSTTNPLAEFGGIAIPDENTPPSAPKFAPYNAAAFGRYTTPENYEKWASTQPKIGPDSKPGEYEAWTSANTPGGYKETLKDSLRPLPYAALAGGTALGVTAIPEVLPSVLIHTVEGVKALGAWAEAHPYKAFMLYQVAKELLPNAKKAMGLIKAAPEVMP